MGAEFKGLVAELTFATKSFFFLMLGYWTDVEHMADWRAWAVMVAAVGAIYPARTAILWLLRQRHARRLVWVAPRGLITVPKLSKTSTKQFQFPRKEV